jgi:hypothetical protein
VTTKPNPRGVQATSSAGRPGGHGTSATSANEAKPPRAPAERTCPTTELPLAKLVRNNERGAARAHLS